MCPIKTLRRYLLTWALLGTLLGIAAAAGGVAAAEEDSPPGYAVVVSQATSDAAAWKPVVEALVEKHQGSVVVFNANVDESLDALRELFPRYVCVVARHEETTRQFVAEVHRLMLARDVNRIHRAHARGAGWICLVGEATMPTGQPRLQGIRRGEQGLQRLWLALRGVGQPPPGKCEVDSLLLQQVKPILHERFVFTLVAPARQAKFHAGVEYCTCSANC